MAGLQKQEKILVFVCGILIGSVFVSFILKKRSDSQGDKELQRPTVIQKELDFLNEFTLTDKKEVLEMDTGHARRYSFYTDQEEGLHLIKETAYKLDSEIEDHVMIDRSYYSSNFLWLYTNSMTKEEILPFLQSIDLELIASSSNHTWLVKMSAKNYQEYIDIQKEIKGLPIPLQYIAPDYRFTQDIQAP